MLMLRGLSQRSHNNEYFLVQSGRDQEELGDDYASNGKGP